MMEIKFIGTREDILAEMAEFLGDDEGDSAAATDGKPKRTRRTKEQIKADQEAALKTAAAGAGAPGAPAPIGSAPSVPVFTLDQAQTALKQAVSQLGEKEGPTVIYGVLTKEFGVEKTKDIPPERRGEFINRLVQLTTPANPTAAGLL